MAAIKDVTENKKKVIMEIGSQAHGAKFREKRARTFGEAAIFSYSKQTSTEYV
jgi:dTDP-4-amino-4,6-dideoxygalactose transaminase